MDDGLGLETAKEKDHQYKHQFTHLYLFIAQFQLKCIKILRRNSDLT